MPIKPGTDTALLLAWMNVLIAEELYDTEFVAEWTHGFDDLAAHVADFTPEWAAPITDLDAAAIRNTARVMASHRPRSVIMPGRHVTWYGNDTQRIAGGVPRQHPPRRLRTRGRALPEQGPRTSRHIRIRRSRSPAAPGVAPPSRRGTPTSFPTGPTGKTRADGVATTFLRGATALQELIDADDHR